MSFEVGFELPAKEFKITRADLIKYAGASLDFNVIHWNERIAKSVGLPNVIAHGMLTMGKAIQIVTDWLDNPAKVVDYQVRFAAPVIVPDNEQGATLEVTAKITENLGNKIKIDIQARSEGAKVLGKAVAIVQL
jgi:acyl dehydratase